MKSCAQALFPLKMTLCGGGAVVDIVFLEYGEICVLCCDRYGVVTSLLCLKIGEYVINTRKV